VTDLRNGSEVEIIERIGNHEGKFKYFYKVKSVDTGVYVCPAKHLEEKSF
jgi:hypothetical protein